MCFNEEHETDYKKPVFQKMAAEARYRLFNRLGKTQDLSAMKQTVENEYRKFCQAERRSLKAQGSSAEEQRHGPVQKLGPEGYWTIISEMKKDPQLKGPDGKDFVKGNECGEKVFYNGSG